MRSSKGTAAWILRYRSAGRCKELSIVNFPDIDRIDAREIFREKRALIDQAGDPAADMPRAPRTGVTGAKDYEPQKRQRPLA